MPELVNNNKPLKYRQSNVILSLIKLSSLIPFPAETKKEPTGRWTDLEILPIKSARIKLKPAGY